MKKAAKKTPMLKNFIVICLCVCMALAPARDLRASDLSGLKNQLDSAQQATSAAQKRLDEANAKLNKLQNEAGELESNYSDLNKKLSSVVGEINSTSAEIQSTSEDIEDLETDLSKAKKVSDKQYEAMKRRIKFMYENNNESAIVSIIQSGSLADFVNKLDYFETIASYDRNMLEKYQKTQKSIEDKTAQLKDKKEALDGYQASLSSKQSELDKLVDEAGDNLSAKQGEVDAAGADAAALEAELARMKAYESQLESAYADAQIAMAGQLAAGGGYVIPALGSYAYNQSDLLLLAALIEAEAGGEIYEGKIAVGSVVMNRVASPQFPNTVSGVIYQNKQFSPVASGRVAAIMARGPSQSCMQAAQATLGGQRNVNKLFFMTVSLATKKGLTGGIAIGNHYFY